MNPAIGDSVFFVDQNGDEVVAAVVDVVGETYTVDLQLWKTVGADPLSPAEPSGDVLKGIPYDPNGAPGTWHWPERA